MSGITNTITTNSCSSILPRTADSGILRLRWQKSLKDLGTPPSTYINLYTLRGGGCQGQSWEGNAVPGVLILLSYCTIVIIEIFYCEVIIVSN